MRIMDIIFGTNKTELLPAELKHKGEILYLRIKKVIGNPKRIWRIRYLSVNSKYLENKPQKMNYYYWRKKHHQYRTRLRSQGATLDEASEKMLYQIELLKKGERELTDY